MKNEQKDPKNQRDEPYMGQEDVRDLKVTQNLLIAAAILCPASLLFFGGVFFSGAGIVCSAIALNKILKLMKKGCAPEDTMRRIRIVSIICLSASIVAFGVNIAAVWTAYSIVMTALETGDFSALGFDFENLGGLSDSGSGNGPSGSSPTWG